MEKSNFLSKACMLVLLTVLLSNFSAFAQKTNIWIVNHAEGSKNSDVLSDIGQERAADLMKALKHEGIAVIYVTNKNVSAQTASPLAVRNKITPMIYADSVQKLADMIKKNYTGKNVLIVADYTTTLHIISALGARAPFESLDKGDYDQLFTVTIKGNNDPESFVRYYGKTNHVNAIPQSYMLDNFTPGVPGH
jgi:2,3-bisphosphoglycerate-dependent phosphoglycerate mutase